MTSNKCENDAVTVAIALGVFSLPLTLLIPNFSVWNAIPKIRVSRYHIISHYLTPSQLNITLIILQLLLFFIYLEIRKRRLQEMVETVLTVARATETTLDDERDKQVTAVRVCAELLDASTDHYENLILLKDELRKREKTKQYPPLIEPSTSNI